jgi:hypothetical protein
MVGLRDAAERLVALHDEPGTIGDYDAALEGLREALAGDPAEGGSAAGGKSEKKPRDRKAA